MGAPQRPCQDREAHLVWVVTQFTEQRGRQVQFLSFEHLLSQGTLLNLDAEALQLCCEPIAHSVNFRPVTVQR